MKLWKAAAIVVAVFALAGAAAGIVSAQQDGETPVPGVDRLGNFMSKLAGNLGITEEQLEAAIDETQLEIIDEKVADGTLTEEQAAELRERVESGEPLFPFGGPPHHRHHLGGIYSLHQFAEAAGITVPELVEAWQGDGTLGEVLAGLGVDVDAVTADILTALEARLVEAGATQERIDEALAKASEKIAEALASEDPPARPFRGRFGDEGARPDGAEFPGFPALEPPAGVPTL
ncbi:MAG: hypothetical protein WD939_07805 [Dehalococcoidia bacterium]